MHAHELQITVIDPRRCLGQGRLTRPAVARNRKFLMTPILRDGSERPLIDVTEMWRNFLREQRAEKRQGH
jgi:hypothetical protein